MLSQLNIEAFISYRLQQDLKNTTLNFLELRCLFNLGHRQ